MRRMIAALVTLLLSALLSSALPEATFAEDVLQVIVFPGGFNWPIWAAQENGLFARERLDVRLTPTPSSVFQLTNLIDGKFDIGMTAIDNVIAYQEGQSEAEVKTTPDLFAFLGADNGLLRLVVVPEVRTYADLKGKELSVDALTTGYAFVLRRMLERGGLRDEDVKLVRAGGVLQRWEALREKKHAGTLLLTPFEILAESAGFRRLGNAIDVLGRYQGLVGAARRSWAHSHADQVVGYVRGYLAGVAWLYDRAHKDEAVRILVKNVRGMTPELAAKTYEVLLDPKDGFFPDGQIDVEGVKTVLALRSEYGRPQKSLTDPERYLDLSYYRKATGR